MVNAILRIILVAAIVVFFGAGAMLFLTMKEYQKGADEYAALSEMVSVEEEPKEDVKKSTYLEECAKYDIPNIRVDIEGLSKKNPDFIGWIYEPYLQISYPVVMGRDDEFYLHKTFEKEDNSSGCIFAGCEAKRDFSSLNTFIYGHNMKNGTMFGSLKKYVRDEETIKNAPYIYIYTEKGACRYKIYSYYITPPTSDTYEIVSSNEVYKEYVNMALTNAVYDCGVEVLPDSRTITLSTCSGTGANKKRLVVHAVIDGEAIR